MLKQNKKDKQDRHRWLLIGFLCLFGVCLVAQVRPTGQKPVTGDSIKSAADTSKSAPKAKTPAGNKKQSDNKKQPENKKTKVYLLHADEGQADKLARPDVQVLIGNVKLRHDSMYMYCDSALIFEKTNSVDGAFLFKKMDGNSTIIAFQMGATANSLKLSIGSSVATVTTPDLATGWHYIGLTYEQGTAKLYVDTNNTAINFVGALPNEIPNTRTDFLIGDKFKGYLDETFVSSLVVGTSGRNPITFDNWNNSKILAYWKYDDATKPGKDSHSWLGRLNNIRTALQGQQGDRRLRLGIAGGEWKKMMADATARTRFASEVKKIIEQYDFDGVDFDFEWPANASEYNNYSATVIQMRSTLGKYVYFTASLHPVSFKISPEAIDALDFISYQCYGPAVMRFPYEQFVKDGEAAVAYGIPKNKLVMGVPFYGSTGSLIAAYCDFVNDGLATTNEDTYTYKGNTYTFNSIETIRKKARYVCEEDYAGIMSWDLATDIDITNNKSLLKVIKEEFEYYANPTE